MGIYVVKDTASSEPSDVRIVLEGVMVLQDLENVALASAMLFGLFYALNLQHPTKLRYTFEAFQKIIMDLDAGELSRKAQITARIRFKTLVLTFRAVNGTCTRLHQVSPAALNPHPPPTVFF